jgi:hypothetical protein
LKIELPDGVEAVVEVPAQGPGAKVWVDDAPVAAEWRDGRMVLKELIRGNRKIVVR